MNKYCSSNPFHFLSSITRTKLKHSSYNVYFFVVIFFLFYNRHRHLVSNDFKMIYFDLLNFLLYDIPNNRTIEYAQPAFSGCRCEISGEEIFENCQVSPVGYSNQVPCVNCRIPIYPKITDSSLTV